MIPDRPLRLADVLPAPAIETRARVLREVDPRVLSPVLEDRLIAAFPPEELEGIACPTCLLAGTWTHGGAMTGQDVLQYWALLSNGAKTAGNAPANAD